MIVRVTLDTGQSKRYKVDGFYVDPEGYVVLINEPKKVVGQIAPKFWCEVVELDVAEN